MRQPNDFYPTESAVTEALIKTVPLRSIAKSVIEPCAGNGAITGILQKQRIDAVYSNDIDPQ